MHFRQAGFSLKARRVFTTGLALFVVPTFALPPGGLRDGAESQLAPAKATRPAAQNAAEPARIAPKKRATSSAETPPGKNAPTSTPAAQKGPPEYADAWPSEFRPSAPDLQLKTAEGRKAEAFSFFAQGLLAEDNADQDAMLAGYRRALELDPSYAELAVKVAYELARRNDVSAGIQILKDSIKAAPKEPLPYIYLSQLYSHYLKKPDIALTYADQALVLAPGNFKCYLAVYSCKRSISRRMERASPRI